MMIDCNGTQVIEEPLLIEEPLRPSSKAAIVRRAVALMELVSQYCDDDRVLTVIDRNGKRIRIGLGE